MARIQLPQVEQLTVQNAILKVRLAAEAFAHAQALLALRERELAETMREKDALYLRLRERYRFRGVVNMAPDCAYIDALEGVDPLPEAVPSTAPDVERPPGHEAAQTPAAAVSEPTPITRPSRRKDAR